MSSAPNHPHITVFISYSHVDRVVAIELQSVLHAHGVRSFLDQDRIDALDILPDRIVNGIAASDCVLLLWSANSAASAWVRREWQTAIDREKKVIPYTLDVTALPEQFSEMVHVDQSDREHGHGRLFKAVLGRGMDGPSEHPFPGVWEASFDAGRIVQGKYKLELRENGQLEGEATFGHGGILPELTDLTGFRGRVHGSWTYNRGSGLLTINMSSDTVMGQQQNNTIHILATGYEQGAIIGKDRAGFSWTFRRLGDRPRSPEEAAKRQLREAIRKSVENNRDNPALAIGLAALCKGAQDDSKFDLGLPRVELRAISEANEKTIATALTKFIKALQRDGWLR